MVVPLSQREMTISRFIRFVMRRRQGFGASVAIIRIGTYPLSVTQRCGSRIIEWASYVIAGDLGRPADRPALRSAEGSPLGEVALLVFPGDISEAHGIAEIIHQLIHRDHVPPNEILVLLRGDHYGTLVGQSNKR